MREEHEAEASVRTFSADNIAHPAFTNGKNVSSLLFFHP